MKEKLQTKTASGHEDFKTAQNENFLRGCHKG